MLSKRRMQAIYIVSAIYFTFNIYTLRFETPTDVANKSQSTNNIASKT